MAQRHERFFIEQSKWKHADFASDYLRIDSILVTTYQV